MPGCARCGHEIVRKRRNLLQRAFDRAVFVCERCGEKYYVRRSAFSIFRRYSECPECGTRDLSKLASRDGIDRITKNPLRRLLVIFGAPLYHCTFCRFQFRDWRGRAPAAKKAAG